MKKIIYTGATGQVGNELAMLQSQYPDFQLIGLTQTELDITNADAVLAVFRQYQPNFCIHAAAYTGVDRAESDAENAHKVNTEGTANIAWACKELNIRLISISTDYVYHGGKNTPMLETDATNPQSTYGRTKYEGEQQARAIYPSGTMIVRTAWVYSSFGNNFVKTMLRLGKEREQLNVVFDQIGTPTYAADLAKALLDIIQMSDNVSVDQWGSIYHYSNEGVCSWYDFAVEIMERAGVNCRVLPIETKDYPTAATRPPFSVLNKSKIKSVFGLQIPHWTQSLKRCLALLGN